MTDPTRLRVECKAKLNPDRQPAASLLAAALENGSAAKVCETKLSGTLTVAEMSSLVKLFAGYPVTCAQA